MKRLRALPRKLLSRPSWLGLAALVLLAAMFRFWRLSTLPPGLSGGEASVGLSALALIHHGTLPGFSLGDGFAPLWSVLEALPVWLLGHTTLALRLWPALLGTLSVPLVWYWARDWYGPRAGWIAAAILAVTPWAVTVSRNASPAVLATVLVPVTLLVMGRAVVRGDAKWWWASGVCFGLNLVAGPLGWMTGLLVVLIAVPSFIRRRDLISRSSLGGLILSAAALAAIMTAVILEWSKVSVLGTAAGLTWKVGTLATTLGKVSAMFNLHGDDNFLHNFGGEPMLNAFIGLMFVIGLMVTITRFKLRASRIGLVAFAVLLLPAILSPTGAPNAAHAAAALPVVVAFAAIGVVYMLDLWYTTFPINSAARSTGLAAILFLLALCVFQGYIQVFRAWSGSAETYVAYNEAAVGVAGLLKPHTIVAEYVAGIYVVAAPGEQLTVAYLTDSAGYTPLEPADIASVTAGGMRQFIITASVRDKAAAVLAAKFPGGKLAPHYSSVNQNELYYDYETAQ